MPVFKDSYDTTMGMVHVTKTIVNAIKESFIKDALYSVNLNVQDKGIFRPVFITGTRNSESDIPLFTHPIKVFESAERQYLCTDLRFFIRSAGNRDTPTDKIEDLVKNRTEYNFAKSRAILNLIWMDEGQTQLKNNLQFGGVVFCNWLAEIISKNFALDYKDQLTIAIVASFYYQSLFSENTVFDEDSKQKMAIHTIKATKAQPELVFQVFDKIGEIKGIEDFCKNVISVTENIRLEKFNLALLLTIVKNSWYGTNAKEIITVALEHPPTWLAVVYTALQEKTFKSSMIYRVAERFGKRGGADEFTNNYVSLIKGCLKPEQARPVFSDYA